MFRLQPSSERYLLARTVVKADLIVDYYFIKRDYVVDLLYLLTNASLAINTDYTYTIILSIALYRPMPVNLVVLPRFRITRLRDKEVRVRLTIEQDEATARIEDRQAEGSDINVLNSRLVTIYYEAYRKVLDTALAALRRLRGEVGSYNRLYFAEIRQIFSLDRKNRPLYSFDPTLIELEESARVLGYKYSSAQANNATLQDQEGGPKTRLGLFSEEEVRQAIDQ